MRSKPPCGEGLLLVEFVHGSRAGRPSRRWLIEVGGQGAARSRRSPAPRGLVPDEREALEHVLDHVVEHEPRRIRPRLPAAIRRRTARRRAGSKMRGGAGMPVPAAARKADAQALARMRSGRAAWQAVKLLEPVAPLIDLIYPPRCPLCGEGLAAQGGLCAALLARAGDTGRARLRAMPAPVRRRAWPKGTICAPCLAEPPRHDGIAAGTLYNDASRKLVLAFKHGRRIALAPLLARLVAARLPRSSSRANGWRCRCRCIGWRLWRRGFNQSALLAREIARLSGAEVLVDGLVRRKATPGAGRARPQGAGAGAVGCDRGQPAPRRQL